MIDLVQYISLSTLILTCLSSQNENVPPMSGFYTDGLDQALDKIEIVYPERVSKDGAFVSYYLPHYYNLESLENRPRRTPRGSADLSDDAIHFFVPIEGEKHHLELWPNLNFLAPGLVIERRDARDVENINKAKISQISQKQCHYNGRIVGKPDSRAALSTCYGLAGYIQLPAGEEYLIEPLKDTKPTYNKEHPHIMYKRSGIKDRNGVSNCLTRGSARDALGERLQWESIFGSQVRKDFSAINMNELMREDTEKALRDSSNTVDPATNILPADSLTQENVVKVDESRLEEENAKSMRIPQSNFPPNGNLFEGNIQANNPSLPQNSYPHNENNLEGNVQRSKPSLPQSNYPRNDNVEGNVQPSNPRLPQSSYPHIDNNIEGNLEPSNPRFPQRSYPHIENDFEGNIKFGNPSQKDPLKFGKFQSEYGNKLKKKPIKEELGSIKLPDANLVSGDPIRPPTSHVRDEENLINKLGAPIFEDNKRLYKTYSQPKRVKRDLNVEFQNVGTELNKDLDVKRTAEQLQSNAKNEQKNEEGKEEQSLVQMNSQINYEKMPYIDRTTFKYNTNDKQPFKSKRDSQAKKEDFSIESQNLKPEITAEKTNKDIPNRNSNAEVIDKTNNDIDMKNKEINDLNNADIKRLNNNADTKEDNTVNRQENIVNEQILNPHVINKENQKSSFPGSESNIKRDIHLDTSEKSWQPGENGDKYAAGKPDKMNHDNVFNTNTKSNFPDGSLLEKNLDNSLENNLKKESKLSKISKDIKGTPNKEDDVVVSAIESVVRDMEKTKVKKDILGGFAHPSPEGKDHISSVICNDAKYVKLDDIPAPKLGHNLRGNGNAKILEDYSKSVSGLIKDSGKTLEVISEQIKPAEKPNKNPVDEIIIRIKTPEGTISEVKQNSEIDSDGLKNNNNEPVTNIEDTGTKDGVIGHERNKPATKIKFNVNNAEKSKRGVDDKHQKEVEEKPNNQDNAKSCKDYPAQDLSIIVEAPQQNRVQSESSATRNKVKRDDNTIHLVIETEPEIKSSDNHNSESPGSNLFCQGRNCLEIKPIYLNDTKAAVTSSNTTEHTKEKVIGKRDAEEITEDEFCSTTPTLPPLKCHDFAHKVFSLELMITVDYKVVQLHEDDDIENFILTIINMVSSNFDDKSIGLNLNVVLVRLILLTTCIKELDSDRFNPEELLENFCTWQVLVNPGRDDHPHHHDLAIFISKMDKCEGQVMGVSYMTSVCRPDKACVICVDEGLLLANSITHQIGHSLGADHDEGQNAGCAPKLPDGSSYHMSPTISETSSAWSVCSRDSIFQFVQTQGSWCLIDFPVVRSYNFPLMLPGQVYSAAQQCKLNFHMTAIPCSIGPFCNKLYCQITDKLCATKGDPPADGTFCASNMWCFHKQCVHIGRRPGAINGEWGPWTEWSLCTRSCGGGVSSGYRICNNPKPENGGRFCIGDRVRHRICQTKPCQGFTESFRDLQCKRTEDRPFRGKIHNWVQYQSLFINIECALVCQNRKGDVVMRSPIVADGTPCKAGTRNVCIQGACRNVGCDFVIDSIAKEDACGVCHGNGTECKIIQGVFDEAISKKGLVEFLRVPKDSGMIFVREVSPSPNNLVVSGSINRLFYLNGLGSEDSMSGDVAFGLTHGVYEKRGGMERIFIRGPTTEDLIFYVLFRDKNKGIQYQYASLEYDPTYLPRYLWQFLDWDACTDPCSGGSQRARAKCVEDRGGVVDDKYCTESSRPIDIVRPCNDFPCQAKWWVSVWSDCICNGATNVMFRSVLCMRANDESGTRVEVVKEMECSMSKKPPTQKPCNYSDTDTDCAKRSIPDDSLFHAHKDLRRAVNPGLAFSAFSLADEDGSVSEIAHSSPDQPSGDFIKESLQENNNLKKSQDQPIADSNKESLHDSKLMKKPQTNKNINGKGSGNKATKPKLDDKDLTDKNKVAPGKIQDTGSLKPIKQSKNEVSGERKLNLKSEEPPLQIKGKQIAKLSQKNSAAVAEESKSEKQADETADENDLGAKDYEGKGVSENCETTVQSSVCPTEEVVTESPTTCKQTCAPQAHRITSCCRTLPHRQYVIKTTLDTTTIRPIAVKLDELNVNNFALTVVPLDYSGKNRLLPQSDQEFINLGSVGQFGVGDELNATVITGQEALDLLEFARSNASEEPVILHEDMHN